jgi:hypothetical protein
MRNDESQSSRARSHVNKKHSIRLIRFIHSKIRYTVRTGTGTSTRTCTVIVCLGLFERINQPSSPLLHELVSLFSPD